MNPGKHVNKIVTGYKRMFGERPDKKVQLPLEKDDNPELDTSIFLGGDGIKKYQSLIGSLQWAISIGRRDIQSAIMTLSSFQAQPRKGHLDQAKQVYFYLSHLKNSKFDLELMNKTSVPYQNHLILKNGETLPTDTTAKTSHWMHHHNLESALSSVTTMTLHSFTTTKRENGNRRSSFLQ